jgi:hypothetical protein
MKEERIYFIKIEQNFIGRYVDIISHLKSKDSHIRKPNQYIINQKDYERLLKNYFFPREFKYDTNDNEILIYLGLYELVI